jgi:hypothetical protein
MTEGLTTRKRRPGLIPEEKIQETTGERRRKKTRTDNRTGQGQITEETKTSETRIDNSKIEYNRIT